METLLEAGLQKISLSPNMATVLEFDREYLTIRLSKLLSKSAWKEPTDLLQLSAIFALMYLKMLNEENHHG